MVKNFGMGFDDYWDSPLTYCREGVLFLSLEIPERSFRKAAWSTSRVVVPMKGAMNVPVNGNAQAGILFMQAIAQG